MNRAARGRLVRRAFARVLSAVPSRVREGRHESIALAGLRGDEPRTTVVVVQLDAQGPDMAIDDVALGHEVRAPDGIQDLISCDDTSAATCQEIQQALLDTRQVNDRSSGTNLAVEDVDLHLTEGD